MARLLTYSRVEALEQSARSVRRSAQWVRDAFMEGDVEATKRALHEADVAATEFARLADRYRRWAAKDES